MILLVIPLLIAMFFATRYGVKSDVKAVRIFSYAGIFLMIALLTLLTFALIIERIED